MKRAFFIACILAILAPLVGKAWQTDTNSTTTATIYVPERPSDVLIGKTGGTNTIWISAGQTTNDWVKVSN